MPNPITSRRLLSSALGVTSPLALGSLTGWYKADSLSLANGTAVGNGSTTDWLDSSGNGHTMTQTSAGARPTFATNIFGTKPGIRFTGAATHLFTNTGFSFTGDYTLLIVFKFSTASDAILMGKVTLNRQVRVQRSGFETASTYNGTAPEIISPTMTDVGSGLGVKCVGFRRTGSIGDFFHQNVRYAAASGTSSATFDLDSFCKGTSTPSGIDGWMAEVVLYSGYKTDTQVKSLYTNYLKPRWGLP